MLYTDSIRRASLPHNLRQEVIRAQEMRRSILLRKLWPDPARRSPFWRPQIGWEQPCLGPINTSKATRVAPGVPTIVG